MVLFNCTCCAVLIIKSVPVPDQVGAIVKSPSEKSSDTCENAIESIQANKENRKIVLIVMYLPSNV